MPTTVYNQTEITLRAVTSATDLQVEYQDPIQADYRPLVNDELVCDNVELAARPGSSQTAVINIIAPTSVSTFTVIHSDGGPTVTWDGANPKYHAFVETGGFVDVHLQATEGTSTKIKVIKIDIKTTTQKPDGI
jgi:hypothetical protein